MLPDFPSAFSIVYFVLARSGTLVVVQMQSPVLESVYMAVIYDPMLLVSVAAGLTRHPSSADAKHAVKDAIQSVK